MKTPKESLETLLAQGNVSFFGYRGRHLPALFAKKKEGRLRAYTRDGQPLPQTIGAVRCERYARLSDIRDEHSDVYFLDHEALKVLFAEFPASAQFVLVRFVPRLSWIVALPGLLRRMQTGFVSLEGIRTFAHAEGKTAWLVLRHHKAESLHTRLSLSTEVGIEGLLTHLANEKRTYVVLRFFSTLPALHREGGDLDLLVLDEDERAVKDFLKAHPGTIGIDVWTVSRVSHNAITYYPPPLARGILERRVLGPAGAYIPSPLDSFHSFAYHVLYHKGLFAGVSTTTPGLLTNPKPENDYAGELMRLAKVAGVETAITMEALDEYLASVGWRPQLDTLAKIAPRNKWVWRRFFSAPVQKEIGLAVIILKQGALSGGLAEAMEERIASYPEFQVLTVKKLTAREAARATKELRGGVWGEQEHAPAIAVVALDTHLARLSRLNATHESTDRGIRHLKKLLRQEFDKGKGSLTHATDYTHEALEYIDVCFPNEKEKLLANTKTLIETLRLSPLETIRFWLSFLPRYCVYHMTRLKRTLRSALVRAVLEK